MPTPLDYGTDDPPQRISFGLIVAIFLAGVSLALGIYMYLLLRQMEVQAKSTPSSEYKGLLEAMLGYGTLLVQLLITFWVATISSRDKTSWRWWGNVFVWTGLFVGFILTLIRI